LTVPAEHGRQHVRTVAMWRDKWRSSWVRLCALHTGNTHEINVKNALYITHFNGKITHLRQNDIGALPFYTNPLEFKGNYRATSNNMKLVHWLLMGGLFWGVSMMNNHIKGSKVTKNPILGAKYAKNSNSFRSVYHIEMKFDRRLQPATETSWVVSYGCKTISRWRTAAILKIVISPIAISQRKNHPIFMKFCTQQLILNWVNVT